MFKTGLNQKKKESAGVPVNITRFHFIKTNVFIVISEKYK